MKPLSTEKEAHILAVARDVFLEKGKQGARMQEIAHRAGVNKALLHYYFRSKEQLYQRVFEAEMTQFIHHLLEAIPQEGDFFQFLEVFVRSYIRRVAASPQLVRFVLWEMREGCQTLHQVLQRVFDGDPVKHSPFFIRVTKAIENGEIRPVDPLHLFMNVLSMCVYPFLMAPLLEQVVPGLDVRAETFIRQREQEILNLLRDGLQPPANSI